MLLLQSPATAIAVLSQQQLACRPPDDFDGHILAAAAACAAGDVASCCCSRRMAAPSSRGPARSKVRVQAKNAEEETDLVTRFVGKLFGQSAVSV